MATPTLVQTITHDRPGDRVGNCVAACVAAFFDVPLSEVSEVSFRTPWQEVPDGR